MAMPLEGIKVVECTGFLMGPRAGAHLADMGAEVIKIEHPQGGDPTRAGRGGMLPPPTGLIYAFELENRGKKSITLELSKEQGRKIAYQLIERADVFLSNYQLGVLQRLGLDYETLSRINPRLIYALGTGWGLKGPHKDRPAFDYAVWARSGLMDAMGEPASPPVVCRPGFGDHITAVLLDYAILLALFHRERTGEGQMVHVSLLSGLVDAAALSLQAHLSTGKKVSRVSRLDNGNPLWNFYETQDHQWIQFAMAQSDRHWHDFCLALGIENLEHDPRFDSHEARYKNCRELVVILDPILASRPRREWEERLEGKNVIWAFVTPYSEVAEDPQLWENGHLVEIDHPQVGRTRIVGVPIQLSKSPGKPGTAPELGQHTEEILLELGYTWGDILRLKDEEIIR